ncbi:MAG: HD domain-containing protein [Omnitrophica WOR_2 bacterium]
MDRLEIVRQAIDEIVRQQPDQEERRCGFVHLYGVSDICILLALKPGLDPQLCAAAGMLHDIWNYKVWDNPEHARLGSQEAGRILQDSGLYTAGEIDQICQAVARHGNKQGIDSAMDELLKDADVFQHYLYNPALPVRWTGRLEKVFAEFGLDPSILH